MKRLFTLTWVLALISIGFTLPAEGFESYTCAYGNSLKVKGRRAVLNGFEIPFGEPAQIHNNIAAFLSKKKLQLIPIGSVVWASTRANGSVFVSIEGRVLNCK